MRAYAYAKVGEYEKALQDADKAISLDAKSEDAYNCIAYVYNMTQQYKQAIIESE